MSCHKTLLIGVTSDRNQTAPHYLTTVGEKYLTAVTDGMNAVPVVIPPLAQKLNYDTLLDRLDGLLFTGAYSMLDPAYYNGPAMPAGTLLDPQRDETSLALMQRAIERGMPVLCICRGFQELNVLFDGSLHQRVHEQDGHLDHRDDKHASFEVQYGPAHAIDIQPGGWLANLGLPLKQQVNSVHEQGINMLGRELKIEATAPDGLVEAVSLDRPGQFCLGLQFHPEYKVKDHPLYQAIFSAFTTACETYVSHKNN